MRLHRHDEVVEAMRSALDRLNPNTARKAMADAALDAMLEAVVRLGVGKEGCFEVVPPVTDMVGPYHEGGWHGATYWNKQEHEAGDFPALILRMEARDDE